MGQPAPVKALEVNAPELVPKRNRITKIQRELFEVVQQFIAFPP